ncbi:MAG TPA: hypothetical protein VEK84_10550 [Terriglobales bacterium]|nr:hypothetical protein [Terriglobales bacterium]
MNGCILVEMTFTLALAALPASAFAQAAAESVLLGGASSAATVKAGSQLNSALNQGSKQLAGRVQQQMQPAPGKIAPVGAGAVSKSPVKGIAVRAGATPAPGPVIASIQGAATHCAPTNHTTSMPGSKTHAESAQTNCSGQSSASESAPQKYKPVITLSLQK